MVCVTPSLTMVRVAVESIEVVEKDSPVYLTGVQSIRAHASGTHVSAVVAYEELS